MRRYTMRINDTQHVIDVEAVTTGLYRVHVDGRVVDVTLEDDQTLAQAAITPDAVAAGRPHPDVVAARGATAAPAPTTAASTTARTTSAARAMARPAPAAPAGAGAGAGAAAYPAGGGAAGGPGTLTAPMPGVVLSVEAPVGTPVSRGDVVLVLEAMKMNNPLRAPRDGVVGAILVEAGQNVAFGAPLARIDEA